MVNSAPRLVAVFAQPAIPEVTDKGAALGTLLAFMMSVIALSLPEMVILCKVLTPRLIATFVGVVATAILIVGYVFNAVLVSRGFGLWRPEVID